MGVSFFKRVKWEDKIECGYVDQKDMSSNLIFNEYDDFRSFVKSKIAINYNYWKGYSDGEDASKENEVNVELNNCTFSFQVNLSVLLQIIKEEKEVDTEYCTLIFESCLFEHIVLISSLKLNCLQFFHVRFCEDFLFMEAKLDNYLKFDGVFFEKSFLMEDCKFFNVVEFENVTFRKTSGIYSCFFEKKLTMRLIKSVAGFSLSEISAKEIEIFFSYFKKFTFKQLEKSSRIILDQVVIDCANVTLPVIDPIPLLSGNVRIKMMDRYTARCLRCSVEAARDYLTAMDYRVRELDLYRKEMRHWRTVWTYLLLSLNKLSNHYGKSWARGIVFMLACWVLFFSLFVIFRDGWGDTFIWNDPVYMREAVSYLWLFDGLNEISRCERISWSMIAVFVLGKVAIAYGIYQTVSAFRRYGGKT